MLLHIPGMPAWPRNAEELWWERGSQSSFFPRVACSSLLVPQMLAGLHRLSSASHKTAICSSEMASSSHWLPHSCLFGSNSLTSVICVCYHFQTKDSPPPSHSTLPLWLLSYGHRGPFAVGWNGCSYATNHSGIINFLLIHPT